MPRAVAILEVMWDWDAMTSSAGYAEQAPEYFCIDGDNFTGRRLYEWLGHYDLLVTNACPQLVSSARGRGTPSVPWLHKNLASLQPFELLLVCGRVASDTFFKKSPHYKHDPKTRVVAAPHPAARMWTRQGLDFARYVIQNGKCSVELRYRSNRLVATRLYI